MDGWMDRWTDGRTVRALDSWIDIFFLTAIEVWDILARENKLVQNAALFFPA